MNKFERKENKNTKSLDNKNIKLNFLATSSIFDTNYNNPVKSSRRIKFKEKTLYNPKIKKTKIINDLDEILRSKEQNSSNNKIYNRNKINDLKYEKNDDKNTNLNLTNLYFVKMKSFKEKKN